MTFPRSNAAFRTVSSLALAVGMTSACQGDLPGDTTNSVGGAASNSGGAASNSGGATSIVSPGVTGGSPSGNGGASTAATSKVGQGGSIVGATGGAPTGGNGVVQTGGSVSVGVGGATGGTTSIVTTAKPTTGGASSVVGCTDTPRSSESCADAKAWGFCSQSWFTSANYCQATCGSCSGPTATGGSVGVGGNVSTGGSKATGGNSNTPTGGSNAATGGSKATGGNAPATGGSNGGATVPRLTNGKDGTTTRYWDCCKPSCGWKANAAQGGKQPTKTCGTDGTSVVGVDTQSACSGGSGFQCYSFAPWSVSDTLSYGYAATGGGNGNCGKCFQLDFTGAGDNNTSALSNKTMIVQAINIGGDVASTQFDLLIPGGGVGAFNACSNQWGSTSLGAQYGGFLTSCNYTNASCVTDYCNKVFGSKPALLAGCQWFTGWFNAANNPKIKYAEVPCPAEITAKSGM